MRYLCRLTPEVLVDPASVIGVTLEERDAFRSYINIHLSGGQSVTVAFDHCEFRGRLIHSGPADVLEALENPDNYRSLEVPSAAAIDAWNEDDA